jgi:tRNA G18 (ribose-2'-O)-methylase SpoU
VTVIDDPADPRVHAYTSLTDAELRRRLEAGEHVLVAEGTIVIRRLLGSDAPVRSVLLTPKRHADLAESLARRPDVEVLIAAPAVIGAVVGFDAHRGALAVAPRPADPGLAAVLATARTVVVLEGINDHENLGAIARSASALGVDALVLDPTCADPYYRRCVRVSMGEIVLLPVTRASGWPGDLATLAAAGFRLLALTPASDATAITALHFEADERVALVLGAEGPGLAAATIARAEPVRIPIRAGVDSLNVGHAAAIAFHEIARRR